MDQQQKLLKELVECRSFLMGQLADLAEEEGRTEDALGWRWLGANNKYPSPRKGGKWGWSFTPHRYFEREVTVPNRIKRTLRDAERRGPTAMPVYLVTLQLMSSAAVATAERALENAATAMGRLLTMAAAD